MYFIYNRDFTNISSFIMCPNDKFHLPNSISSTLHATKPSNKCRYIHPSFLCSQFVVN